MQLLSCSLTLETLKPCIHYILQRMKMVSIFILAACLQSWATGHTQSITLSLKETKLEKVFQLIRQQTNYRFIYAKEDIIVTKPVTVELQNVTLEQAMNSCLAGQPIEWSVDDNQVIIKRKQETNLSIQLSPKIDIKGKITGPGGEPLSGATIMIKGANKTVVANEKGEFTMEGVEVGATLVISSLGYQSLEYVVKDDKNFTVQLKPLVSELENIKVSTGYEELPKERATGSFEKVNNELLNRNVTLNVLERLQGIVPGLIFNKKIGTTNPTDISIRGISTINSDQRPLIVVDNFPYEGNINNINPNDVESITVLKDAAAASIWGAKAGNGVIVITTKKAKYNQPTKLTLNNNVTIINEPDLYYLPPFTPGDFIDIEKYLFDKGFYNGDLSSSSFPVISPLVEMLNKRRSNLISPGDSSQQIGALLNNDILGDYKKYLYRRAINSQHALSLSGGNNNVNYLFAVGYDKNLATLIGDESSRLTLRTFTNVKPIRNLELQLGILFTQTQAENNSLGTRLLVGGGKGSLYPYARLIDDNGNALAVPKDYRSAFTDTAGLGKILDWKYRPLDELKLADNTSRSTDLLLNVVAKFNVSAWLNLELKYQHEKTFNTSENFQSIQSYSTRASINFYTPKGASAANSAIPMGGILDKSGSELTAHALRGQLNFNKTLGGKHELTSILGTETRQVMASSDRDRIYGYDDKVISSQPVNYLKQHPTYFGYETTLFNNFSMNEQMNRFVSFYANASYTYNQRYSFSVSGRRDASNLFGTSTNNKWKPLWSAGLGWLVSNEAFFPDHIFSFMRLRTTWGHSGNVNNTTPALLTIQSSRTNDLTGLPVFNVFNPPNPSLRWENVAMVNLGLDFTTTNKKISGSIEYYLKKSTDLIASMASDITTGYANIIVNSAELKGRGVDISVNSLNIDGAIRWTTDWLFSYNTNKVSQYLLPLFPKDYLTSPITPIEGENAYSIISYRWGGLDPSTGNPLGFLEGRISGDYREISRSVNPADIVIHGPTRPEYFGALRNGLTWKNLALSVNLVYRFKYFFRRTNVLRYSQLYSSWAQEGYTDYLNRWQKPGDEINTNVPSMIYPADNRRDNFYQLSEAVVERGDHIRLQDINVSYTLTKSKWKKSPFSNVKIYGYLNNLGIVWKATKEKIDPDYGTPLPLSFSLGAMIEF